MDVITGGSVGHVARKKRRGLVDVILTVSEQPARKDRAYPGTVIYFFGRRLSNQVGGTTRGSIGDNSSDRTGGYEEDNDR